MIDHFNDDLLFSTTTGMSTDKAPSLEELAAMVDRTKAEMDAIDETVAEALMRGGYSLVPCDWLGGKQLAVGTRLYEAAKRVAQRSILTSPVARPFPGI